MASPLAVPCNGLTEGSPMERKMENQAINQELVTALVELQKQLHSHIKMNVKKHYSLMVADAQASKAIGKARSE
jgi:hypothetical protein